MSIRYYTKEFWNRFLEVQTDIEQALKNQDTKQAEVIIKPLRDMVQNIAHSILDIEYDGSFFELTFDGGFDKKNQFICKLLKQEAPKSIVENWMVHAFRQPLSTRAYAMKFEAGGKIYLGSDIIVYHTQDASNRLLHLQVFCEGFRELNDEQRASIFERFLLLYIGQVEFEARIGSIEFLEDQIPADTVCLLPNLYEEICDIVLANEWVDYAEPTSIYFMFQQQEERISEEVREDMRMIITSYPMLQEEILSNNVSICEEFLKMGGEFGYLYYKITQEADNIAPVRQQLERELQELFQLQSVAHVFGGAVGEIYAYIDVAVYDTQLFALVLEKLQEHLDIHLTYLPFVSKR